MRQNTSWARIALIAGLLVVAASGWLAQESAPHRPAASAPSAAAAGYGSANAAVEALPPEARHTLRLIAAGGPFPYDRDGTVFQNRERRLPQKPRGYYREYTVATPGGSDRGARRIVTGGDPPVEYFYSDDHYRSFTRLESGTR